MGRGSANIGVPEKRPITVQTCQVRPRSTCPHALEYTYLPVGSFSDIQQCCRLSSTEKRGPVDRDYRAECRHRKMGAHGDGTVVSRGQLRTRTSMVTRLSFSLLILLRVSTTFREGPELHPLGMTLMATTCPPTSPCQTSPNPPCCNGLSPCLRTPRSLRPPG
jgi:hypothetical protein